MAHTILTPEESKVSEDILSRLHATLPQRFWDKVQITETCWIWIGGKRDSRPAMAYGCFYWQGARGSSHIIVWTIANERPSGGLDVCHKCDNPSCVNPSHLFLGTRSENMRDCSRKGRTGPQRHPESRARGERHGSKTKPERLRRGENNPIHKLTEENVIEIKKSLRQGCTKLSLARAYGVSEKAIYQIAYGICWKWVVID